MFHIDHKKVNLQSIFYKKQLATNLEYGHLINTFKGNDFSPLEDL